MTLLEILLTKWDTWVAGQAVEQTSLGDIFCSTHGRRHIYGHYEIADDRDTAVVTKAQWEAQRSKTPDVVQYPHEWSIATMIASTKLLAEELKCTPLDVVRHKAAELLCAQAEEIGRLKRTISALTKCLGDDAEEIDRLRLALKHSANVAESVLLDTCEPIEKDIVC